MRSDNLWAGQDKNSFSGRKLTYMKEARAICNEVASRSERKLTPG